MGCISISACTWLGSVSLLSVDRSDAVGHGLLVSLSAMGVMFSSSNVTRILVSLFWGIVNVLRHIVFCGGASDSRLGWGGEFDRRQGQAARDGILGDEAIHLALLS